MSRFGKSLSIGILCAVALFFLREAWTDFAITRRIFPKQAAETSDGVARVLGQTINHSQLERALRERLWLDGKDMDSLTRDEIRAKKKAALDALIDQELLRSRAAALAPSLKVSPAEIEDRLRLMEKRFPTPDEMEQAMKSQGIAGMKELRDRLAARIQQEKYVELRIGKSTAVTEEEAAEWFDAHKAELSIPERVEVRHIFLPTLDHPSDECETKLKAALADLTEKRKDFAKLASELSEDPASKDAGGSLGWMTRARLPEDFAAAVFSLKVNTPSLVRSRIGWHLVEVTGRKPAEPQSFQQAKPEIIAALSAVKRTKAIEEARATLRKEDAARIEIFDEELRR